MRSLLLVLTTTCACAAGHIDEAGPDAGAPPPADAAVGVDGSADAGCRVYVPGASTDRGKAGGTGGSKNPLQCDDVFNERIVGIALQMSNGATVFGGRSAQGIMIECAPVTVDPAGTAQVGTANTKQISGTGQFGWSPSTWTQITHCPPGSVLTGVLAHRGSSDNRFLDVTMTCTQLDAGGKLGASKALKIVGSLVDATSPSQASCGAGEVVSSLGAWTGAGLDAVSLFCGAPACR